MTICRQIDEELSLKLGRAILLCMACKDNVQFILSNPDLGDKLEYWQEQHEAAMELEQNARSSLEDTYLKGMSFNHYFVNPSSYLLCVDMDDISSVKNLQDWRILD